MGGLLNEDIESQILARNGDFVVTVACKSKTTQSALCLDEASAECQARTPRKRRMRISSVACGISNAHGRKSRYRNTGRALLWYAVVSTRSKEPGRGARARHAARWLLGALEEAGRTCANAVRGARERQKNEFYCEGYLSI